MTVRKKAISIYIFGFLCKQYKKLHIKIYSLPVTTHGILLLALVLCSDLVIQTANNTKIWQFRNSDI